MSKSIRDNCPKSMTECASKLLPVKDALDILSGKWKIPIIVSLSFGPKRFKVIQREVTGITAKMLSKELRDLEVNQLVSRTVYDTKPVAIEYDLTKYGDSLQDLIAALGNWGALHRKKIIGKRA